MYRTNKYKLISEQRQLLGHCVCEYCGRGPLQQFNDSRRSFLTIDHVVPKSKGGSDEISNLKISCIECNRIKGSDGKNIV